MEGMDVDDEEECRATVSSWANSCGVGPGEITEEGGEKIY